MDLLISEACKPGPIPTLLRDTLEGPLDASFFLYHFLGAGFSSAPTSCPAAVALIATSQPPSHHRALLRKCLGPAQGDSVSMVCAQEVCRRLAGPVTAASLAAGLLGAASGGSGVAPGLWLAVEDVQGLCELAGGVSQGLAVLRHLASAQPRGLLARAEGACDWVLDDEGGVLVAPTLGSALEGWAHTVVLAARLPSGFSRDAHGRMEVWRKGAPAEARVAALFKVSADGTAKDPSAAF
jgi:hypothetical protein